MDRFDFPSDWSEKHHLRCDWLDHVTLPCDHGLDTISFRTNTSCYSDLLISSASRSFKHDFDFKLVPFYKGNLVYQPFELFLENFENWSCHCNFFFLLISANELVRNVKAIVQYTFVFVLWITFITSQLKKKTCTERYISVEVWVSYHTLLCDVIAISFVIFTSAVIPLIKLSRDKASLKKSLWLPMKLQQVQCSWWVVQLRK